MFVLGVIVGLIAAAIAAGVAYIKFCLEFWKNK